MEVIVQLLMLLVCWMTSLKLSHSPRWFVWLYALCLGLFVFLNADLASSQTKDDVVSYIEQHSLREYITILVTIEAMVMIAFAFLGFRRQVYEGKQVSVVGKSLRLFLQFCPPVLMLPTIFYLHTTLLFYWTGVDFHTLSLYLATIVLLFCSLSPSLIRYLLPEQDIRLELLFLSSLLVFILGLIITIDTQLIYKAPKYVFPFKEVCLSLGLLVFCFALGYFSPMIKNFVVKKK